MIQSDPEKADHLVGGGEKLDHRIGKVKIGALFISIVFEQTSDMKKRKEEIIFL